MRSAFLRTTFNLILLAAMFGIARNASADADFCWAPTYGRGAGSVPQGCNAGDEYSLGLCYSKCPTGFRSAGVACWPDCPQDFRDDGLYCAKIPGTEYGRGWGYPWKFGDWAFNYDQAKARCERCEQNEYGCVKGAGNCEMYGLIWYPKCKAGWHPLGANICTRDCPNRTIDIGVSCMKIGAGRVGGYIPTGCPAGSELDAGLCYQKCKDGFTGVGPVCWGQGPPGWVNCGFGFAKSSAACGLAITDQVLSVVDFVGCTAVTILSLGTSSAATAELNAAKTALTNAEKIAANALRVSKTQAKALDAMVKASKKLVLETSEKGVKAAWDMRLIGKLPYEITGKAFTAGTMVDAAAHADEDSINFLWDFAKLGENTTMTDAEKRFEVAKVALSTASLVDPIGIVGVVGAYTKPVCTAIGAMAGGVSELTKNFDDITATAKNELDAAQGVYNDINVQLTRAKASTDPAYQQMIPELTRRLADAQIRVTAANEALNIAMQKKDRVLAGAQSAGTQSWVAVPGSGSDISVGKDGTVWIVGAQGVIYRVGRKDPGWISLGGGAVRISSGTGAEGWAVNGGGELWLSMNGAWTRVCPAPALQVQSGQCSGVGKIVDVAAAGDGTVWLVNDQGMVFGGAPKPGTPASFTRVAGPAVKRIAGGGAGEAYAVDGTNQVFRVTRNGTTSLGYIAVQGVTGAQDVAASGSGAVWAVASNGALLRRTPTGSWQLDASGGAQPSNLTAIGAGGAVAAVDSRGVVSLLDVE